MKLKLFGKNIFEFNKREYVINEGYSQLRDSKFLPDFYQDMGSSFDNIPSETAMLYAMTEADIIPTAERLKKKNKQKKTGKKQKEESQRLVITPKGVYEMKMLNDNSFKIKTDDAYIAKTIKEFTDKLGLVRSEEYDMNRGVKEIQSVLIRMENRKKYAKFRKFFDEFPYTNNTKIREVLKSCDNLKLGQVAQFVADMPAEATAAMKEYTKQTQELCKKNPVFYIIADKKDFQKTEKRRDPILLAQSPFGHFWQILGVWDKEMLLLEDL
ncbi:MAG: hypothetical protein PHQ35_10645 [Phycisphaerae bacterium]|nr:hypothetical protein [Phycisphaerae bacterium]